ncbi:MAG: hypothetical protein U1E42_13715 [Rhodospirillales bacterium]
MTRDVHQVPGRVRFKVPGLRDDEALVRALPQALRAHAGVYRVEVRPASSSLIVHYDPAGVDCRTLADFVNGQLPGNVQTETLGSSPTGSSFPENIPTTAFLQGASTDDFLVSPMRHVAVAFGRAAFRVALEQAVRGGVNSLFRVTGGRF